MRPYECWFQALLFGSSIFAAGCTHSSPSKASPAHTALLESAGTDLSRAARLNPDSKSAAADRELEKRAHALATFSAGLIAQEKDDQERALGYFAESIGADPDNEALSIDVARRYWTQLQTNRAVEVMRVSASRPGASADAKAYLGSLYLQTRRYPEAIAAFQSAVATDPQNLANYQALVPLLIKNNQVQDALRLLDKAANQSNTDAAYWADLGGLYGFFESADPKAKAAAREKGLACLHRCEALNSTDPMVLQRLGDRYSAFNDPIRAETIFRQLRAKYPGNPAPTAKLAELYLRQGKTKEAKEQLEALRRNNPADPAPYYYLGLVAMEERQASEAVELFDRVIFLNPEFEPAYSELGAARLTLRQENQALRILDQSRQKFGPSYRVEFLSALAEGRLKHYSRAEEHFVAAEAAALVKQPEALDHRFYFQWGVLLEQAGKREDSERRIRKSLAIKPDFDEALNHLAYTWVEQGIQLLEARKMIEQAVRSDPDNPAYLDSLGWVLFKLGKPLEALPYLEKASKLMPEPDATVEDHVGDVLKALGRNAEAKAAWERSLKVEKSDVVQKKIDAAR